MVAGNGAEEGSSSFHYSRAVDDVQDVEGVEKIGDGDEKIDFRYSSPTSDTRLPQHGSSKGGGGSGLAHEEERVVAVGGPEASVDQFWIHWAGRGEAHGGVYTAVFLAPHTETFRVVAWGDRFFLDKVTCAFSNHALFNFDPQQTKNALNKTKEAGF